MSSRKDYFKKYYQDNIEQIKIKRKVFRESHTEEISERGGKYREKNKERLRNSSKQYYQNNKGRLQIEKRNRQSKRRARYKITDVTSSWLETIMCRTKICEVCNRKMKKKSIDHIIPLNMGGLHIMSNIRIICLKCNQQRPKNGSDIIQFRLI